MPTTTVNIRATPEDAAALEDVALNAGLPDPRSVRWETPRGSLAALMRALAQVARERPGAIEALVRSKEAPNATP